jgi:hypothetical protein
MRETREEIKLVCYLIPKEIEQDGEWKGPARSGWIGALTLVQPAGRNKTPFFFPTR